MLEREYYEVSERVLSQYKAERFALCIEVRYLCSHAQEHLEGLLSDALSSIEEILAKALGRRFGKEVIYQSLSYVVAHLVQNGVDFLGIVSVFNQFMHKGPISQSE